MFLQIILVLSVLVGCTFKAWRLTTWLTPWTIPYFLRMPARPLEEVLALGDSEALMINSSNNADLIILQQRHARIRTFTIAHRLIIKMSMINLQRASVLDILWIWYMMIGSVGPGIWTKRRGSAIRRPRHVHREIGLHHQCNLPRDFWLGLLQCVELW